MGRQLKQLKCYLSLECLQANRTGPEVQFDGALKVEV